MRVAYLWTDVVRYTKGWFRSVAHREVKTLDERVAWFLVIGTIPGAIAGAAFESVIEDKLGQPLIIADHARGRRRGDLPGRPRVSGPTARSRT